ncbi:NB-ARC domain-containing protein [Glycomyces sambucus]|uniref:NB-ARC domain-containing protein n=1 Tax=Glycomyces sambucus TaxID=380244 RepID=A0A1G9CNW2_9ACTN|nr:tetratricopeptide repeat protein [Glycomyces sambucus]SDK53352.1 NB-ARC domain-containing protein [Glycomyces sambucus]
MHPGSPDTAARFAAWLATHLERHRLTVADVARDLRVSPGQVRGWLAAAGVQAAPEPGEFDHLDTPVKLGAWLRARIADAGTSVRELAESTPDVSMSTVYNWIKGEHLPPPPAVDEPDRFDLLLSSPALGLGLQQRVQLDEIRRRFTGTSLHPDTAPEWDARSLPAASRAFTGRRPALRRLDRLLADHGRGDAVLAIVTGIGGVGKTALAVRWARSAQVRSTFPDGCLHLDLQGYSADAPVDPATARLRLLYQLGADPHRPPPDPEAQAALYQRMLTGRRLLLVLDNARDETQVRPLLPADPGCLTLVTSRARLSGLDVTSPGITRLDLDALTETEAAALLRELLGRLAAGPATDEEVRALADLCGRLPLALQIAAANYLTHHHPQRHPLAAYTAELAADRLGELAIDPADPATAVTPTLDHSLRHLGAAAQRAYRLLGLHRAPDFAEAWAASVIAEPRERTRAVLGELVQANLLTLDQRGRYAFHDLLRDHAAALAARTDDAHERRAAIGRGLDHWRHSGFAATMVVEPSRDRITLDPAAPGAAPERFDDFDTAKQWIEDELEGVVAASVHATETGFDAYVWQLVWFCGNPLGQRGQWNRLVELGELALQAGLRTGQSEAVARAHRYLAHPAILTERLPEARTHLQTALELHRADGDGPGRAAVLHSLSYIEERLGNYAAALACSEEALAVDRERGFLGGQARALNEVGWLLVHLDRVDEALAPCLEAYAIFEELGDRGKAAHVADSLGYLRHRLGDHAGALADFGRAADEFRALDRPFELAGTLDRLGDLHRDATGPDSAAAVWQEALDLYTDLGHGNAEEVRAKLRGLERPDPTGPDPD